MAGGELGSVELCSKRMERHVLIEKEVRHESRDTLGIPGRGSEGKACTWLSIRISRHLSGTEARGERRAKGRRSSVMICHQIAIRA